MHTGKTTFILTASLFYAAYSYTVDFSPVKVGNTWLYQNSTCSKGSIDIPHGNTLLRKMTITKATKGSPDTNVVTFDVSVHDSGYSFTGYGPSTEIGSYFDNIYTVNSVVKTRDSIKNAGSLAQYFAYSMMDTASWDSSTSSMSWYGRFIVRDSVVTYDQVLNITHPLGGGIDSAVYTDEVGLSVWYKHGSWHDGSFYENSDVLIRFYNTSTIQNPPDLIDQKKSAFLFHSRKSDIRKMMIVGNSGYNPLTVPKTMFDVRGRLIPRNSLRPGNGVFVLDAETR